MKFLKFVGVGPFRAWFSPMMSLLQVGETELKLTQCPRFTNQELAQVELFFSKDLIVFLDPDSRRGCADFMDDSAMVGQDIEDLKMTLPWVIPKSIGYTWR